MNSSSIKSFLETMCQNNTAGIQQVFATKQGPTLSVRCVPGTNTFELIESETQEVLHIDSADQVTKYILTFIASYDLSTNS